MFISDFFSAPYNAVTGQLTDWQKKDLAESESDQINAVSDNAARWYGADSDTALIAERIASEQSAQAATDQTTLGKLAASDPGACNGGLNLNGLGLGCIDSFDDFLSKLNTLTHVGLVLVALLIVGYFGLILFPSVAPALRRAVK